jgi:hypothetical protein
MNDYASRLEKKAQEKDDQKFASKKQGIIIYLPSLIPTLLAFFLIAMGMASEASPYIMMGSLLALVCGSLGLCRKKIIQQDKAIRLLQERLDEVSGTAD